jgi:hypothetical protein
VSGLLDNLGNLVAHLWQGSQAFLWGCAAACLLVFALLCGTWYFGFANAAEIFSQYGLLVLIAAIVFTALATARAWEARPKKIVFFVSNEEQSVWGHSRQTTGEVLTSFNFRMAATNISDGSVHLSKPRIAWPLQARWREHVTAVLLTRNTSTFHAGQEFAVDAHRRTLVSGVIALKGAVCRAGKRLTFVVSVSDHEGKRHRIKFKHVRATNTKPV